ncbi:unannotated protein [freshwater metagenome]|uniref:Unannotated protein n=1 Tax=freshwater metagenome TaxID=449393 RepID=A0A6J6YRS8_9ZZZZ
MIWIFTGVPTSVCTNCLTPARTWVIDVPIELDSSTITVMLPPQRLRTSAKDGAP